MSVRYRDNLAQGYVVEQVWIPLPDGTRLHAKMWRPSTTDPTPAILEYLPYRVDDWTWPRDSERYPYYAAHGYTCLRVDIRGTGSSDGVFDDEYSPQEQADGLDVIAWIAEQRWCTGAVGLIGISWGGFNSLQLAAHRPEPVKAIVTVCSSDDRYDNDVHYIGGAVLGIDMAAWASTMFAFNARPPRPEVVGRDWVARWRDRLAANRPMAPTWLSHQERDDYWRYGSVCEDYSSIAAAVLAVGGWADPYRDTVFRLVDQLSCPVRGIIGPWSHHYPDRPRVTGPGIDFLGETLRWWDHWLKGAGTEVLDEPPLRAWINESVPPATHYDTRAGRWVAVDNLAQEVEWRVLAGSDAATALPAGTRTATLRSPVHTGVDAGRYFPYGNATDMPPDQREEDARGVCFDHAVGELPVDVLGRARVRLRLTCDAPRGQVIVRLCDVDPTGASTLVTLGVLNLLKRDGMQRISPMPVGEPVDVVVELRGIGHSFAAGHRMRVAVSSQYWPWVWPHPEQATLVLDLADCALELPVWPHPPRPMDEAVRFGDPVQARPIEIGRVELDYAVTDAVDRFGAVEYRAVHRAPRSQRSVFRDIETGRWVLEVDPGYDGTRRYPDGLDFTEDSREYYVITQDDPLSARTDARWSIAMEKPQWAAQVHTSSSISATADRFVCTNRLVAWARDGVDAEAELVAEHEWHDEVPRTSC